MFPTHTFFAQAVSEARIAAEGYVFSLAEVSLSVFSTFDVYVFCGCSSGLNASIPAAWCSLFTSRVIFVGPPGRAWILASWCLLGTHFTVEIMTKPWNHVFSCINGDEAMEP